MKTPGMLVFGIVCGLFSVGSVALAGEQCPIPPGSDIRLVEINFLPKAQFHQIFDGGLFVPAKKNEDNAGPLVPSFYFMNFWASGGFSADARPRDSHVFLYPWSLDNGVFFLKDHSLGWAESQTSPVIPIGHFCVSNSQSGTYSMIYVLENSIEMARSTRTLANVCVKTLPYESGAFKSEWQHHVTFKHPESQKSLAVSATKLDIITYETQTQCAKDSGDAVQPSIPVLKLNLSCNVEMPGLGQARVSVACNDPESLVCSSTISAVTSEMRAAWPITDAGEIRQLVEDPRFEDVFVYPADKAKVTSIVILGGQMGSFFVFRDQKDNAVAAAFMTLSGIQACRQ